MTCTLELGFLVLADKIPRLRGIKSHDRHDASLNPENARNPAHLSAKTKRKQTALIGTMEPEELASQLRRPHGEAGRSVASHMNKGNERINLYAVEALRLQPGHTVLEIGMGNGHFAGHIVALAPEVSYVGADFSDLMVTESANGNSELVAEGRARFVLADVHDLPFEADTFDAVMSVNNVYFWDRPREALAQIHRVLRRDGQFVVAVRPRRLMECYPFTRHGFAMYSPDELRKLLTSNGFAVESIQEFEEPSREVEGTVLEIGTLVARAWIANSNGGRD